MALLPIAGLFHSPLKNYQFTDDEPHCWVAFFIGHNDDNVLTLHMFDFFLLLQKLLHHERVQLRDVEAKRVIRKQREQLIINF